MADLRTSDLLLPLIERQLSFLADSPSLIDKLQLEKTHSRSPRPLCSCCYLLTVFNSRLHFVYVTGTILSNSLLLSAEKERIPPTTSNLNQFHWRNLDRIDTDHRSVHWRRHSYGALEHVPPRPPTIYLFHFTLEVFRVEQAWRTDGGFCAVASPNNIWLFKFFTNPN